MTMEEHAREKLARLGRAGHQREPRHGEDHQAEQDGEARHEEQPEPLERQAADHAHAEHGGDQPESVRMSKFCSAKAISTGRKVPKVSTPTTLRRMATRKAPTGNTSKSRRLVWVASGSV
jgi:hypothetical protein